MSTLASFITLLLCVDHAMAQDCHVWSQVMVDSAPDARSSHTMAYDTDRRRAVLVGGDIVQQLGGIFGDTWEWDGFEWTQVASTGPAPRVFASAAYDSARRVTVLFGGYGLYGDTWEWNGDVWTFRTDSGPSPRYAQAMVYDTNRGVTVLFGGGVSCGIFCGIRGVGDTWEWNGSLWRRVSGIGPSGRYLHAMAFDEARGVTVLVGGYGGRNLGDLWEWDGRIWVRRDTDGPTPRRLHALAYDSARKMTVMFGGVDSDENLLNDTWGWDGQAWIQLASDGPAPREHHAMVYDDDRGALVLFGGTVDRTVERNSVGDTWRFADCVDHDEDGVFDHLDECLSSDLEKTVNVGDCETGVGNELFDDGCTMADRIAQCGDETRNHGEFVSCVTHLTNDWRQQELISQKDRTSIQTCAARSKERNPLHEVLLPGKQPLPVRGQR